MKSKQFFLVIAAVLLVLPFHRSLAEGPITFEVVVAFNYPSAKSTVASVINDRDQVGGWCAFDYSMVRGFIRLADGQITAPISVPGSLNGTTYIAGLNNTGMASGHYETGSGVDGFLYSNSTFTTVHMDAYETDVEKVNDAGNYCGSTIAPSAAFVSIGGVLTTFNIPGADGTGAEGINNFDQVVGGYTTGETTYGYRRDADGTLSYPFTVPGAWFTTLRAINDRGWIVGTVSSNTTGTHGVLFRSPDSYVLYDYPGAGTTTFNGINSSGLICGNFYDNKNNPHVFVVRARPVAGE